MQETKRSFSFSFITLTYAPEHVPVTLKKFMTLDKTHVQKFMKRLRKRTDKRVTLKYYACGEYGSQFMRPHYHLILFNSNYEHVQDAWQLGSVYFGSVTSASIGYCLKYLNKQKKVPQHSNDDRLPEFQLVSKGLGANYLTPEMVEWHKNDINNRMYLTIDQGKKVSMPRYYKDKIYTPEERDLYVSYNHELQQQRMLTMELELLEKYNGDPYAVQAAREQVILDGYRKMYSKAEQGRFI